MSSTEPLRVVRTEQDLEAPTGEGTVYVASDGSRWRNRYPDGRTQGTGVRIGKLRGDRICFDYAVGTQSQ